MPEIQDQLVNKIQKRTKARSGSVVHIGSRSAAVLYGPIITYVIFNKQQKCDRTQTYNMGLE